MNEGLQHKTEMRILAACSLFFLVALSFSACKLSVDDEVYPLASAKSRTMAAAAISPGDGSEYAFTYDTQPSIEITSPIDGAVAYYAIDGGAYGRYTGAFTLPITDPKVDQTFTVTAYVAHSGYKDSAPVSQTYRFVASTVPTPTITVTPESTFYHFYYHYDSAPTVSATCSLGSATIWYSLDGGATYERYGGSFSLPLPSDQTVIQTVSLRMYASATGFFDSAVVSASCRFAPAQSIVTIAGTGATGSSGDGGNALDASLNLPEGICVDDEKNVYVAELFGHCVRRIGSDGIVSTLAGTGGAGYFGDDGPARLGKLSNPRSLAIDTAKGVLYVADSGNHCVRAISLNDGTITRFAGALSGGSSTDGTPRLSGDINPCAVWFGSRNGVATLFVADQSQKVWYVDADSAVDSPLHILAGGGGTPSPDNVPASDGILVQPTGVCSDSNSLYIADNGMGINRVYRVDFASSKIFTVCTDPYAQPFQPCIDNGALYFTESPGNRVQRYASSSLTLMTGMTSGTAATLADEVDGAMPDTTPTLNTPMGMFLVPHDGLYVADRGNNRVRKIILY